MLDILFLLAVHFFADFLFQSDWMAINKSKHWDVLLLHVAVYTTTFVVALFLLIVFSAGWSMQLIVPFAIITFVTHFVTDAITSRIMSMLWFVDRVCHQVEGDWWVPTYTSKRHWFFVMIGFDQLLHAWQLLLTWQWVTT